jgi:hypothetical protein
MRPGHLKQFVPRFRQGNVENILAPSPAFQQKLQRQRRFPGAGVALDKIKSVGRQTAAQDLIESFHAARATFVAARRRVIHLGDVILHKMRDH